MHLRLQQTRQLEPKFNPKRETKAVGAAAIVPKRPESANEEVVDLLAVLFAASNSTPAMFIF